LEELAVGRGGVIPMKLGAPNLKLLEAAVKGNDHREKLRPEFHFTMYFP